MNNTPAPTVGAPDRPCSTPPMPANDLDKARAAMIGGARIDAAPIANRVGEFSRRRIVVTEGSTTYTFDLTNDAHIRLAYISTYGNVTGAITGPRDVDDPEMYDVLADALLARNADAFDALV